MPKRFWTLITLLAFSLGVFYIHMDGVQILAPTYIDWLYELNSDFSIHYTGWAFFRNQPWTYPLDTLTEYAHPMISSIAYTDSLPILAIPFKLISGVLPDSFQYFGLWLLICYVLNTYLGFKIVYRLTSNLVFAVLGALFFTVASTVLYRTPHPALCAQWLLLWQLYVYLRNDRKTLLTEGSAGVLLAAWIHPYLTIMSLGLWACSWLRLTLNKAYRSWPKHFAAPVFLIVGIYILFHAAGYFIMDTKQVQGIGLGSFSANLNSFINPLDFSTWLPSRPLAFAGQYEGYSYLGLGGLVLFLLMLTHCVRYPSIFRRHAALVIGLIVFGIMAYNPVWTWDNSVWMEWSVGHQFFYIFRSTGRFIWPLYYLILIAGLWKIYAWNGKWKGVVLVLLLSLQVIDLWPLINRPILHHEPFQSVLSEAWNPLFEFSETIYLFPPYADRYVSNGDPLSFMELARRYQKPITLGRLARRDDEVYNTLFQKLKDQLESGEGLDPKGVYIFDLASFPVWEQRVQDSIGYLRKLDDYYFYLPVDSAAIHPAIQDMLATGLSQKVEGMSLRTVQDILNEYPRAYTFISVKDEASQSWCNESRDAFRDINAQLADLAFRDSYLGIFHQQRSIQEKIDQGDVETNFTMPNQMVVYLHSGGANASNRSEIKVNGEDLSPNQRGMNIVVLDSLGNPLHAEVFDTYEQCAKVNIRY